MLFLPHNEQSDFTTVKLLKKKNLEAFKTFYNIYSVVLCIRNYRGLIKFLLVVTSGFYLTYKSIRRTDSGRFFREGEGGLCVTIKTKLKMPLYTFSNEYKNILEKC